MSEILNQAEDYAKYLHNHPGEDPKITLKFDRKRIDEMSPDKVKEVLVDDTRIIMSVFLKGVKLYLKEKQG